MTEVIVKNGIYIQNVHPDDIDDGTYFLGTISEKDGRKLYLKLDNELIDIIEPTETYLTYDKKTKERLVTEINDFHQLKRITISYE